MSAAIRGTGYAALQGFLAGCLQLAVELRGGRNRFANRARFTALLALSAWISLKSELPNKACARGFAGSHLAVPSICRPG